MKRLDERIVKIEATDTIDSIIQWLLQNTNMKPEDIYPQIYAYDLRINNLLVFNYSPTIHSFPNNIITN